LKKIVVEPGRLPQLLKSKDQPTKEEAKRLFDALCNNMTPDPKKVNYLLESKNSPGKKLAAKMLGNIRKNPKQIREYSQQIDALSEYLSDPDKEVRKETADAFVQLTNSSARFALEQGLSSSHPDVRQASHQMLLKGGDCTVLFKALSPRNSVLLRRRAAFYLGLRCHRGAVQPLKEHFLPKEKNFGVLMDVGFALARLRSVAPEASKILEDAKKKGGDISSIAGSALEFSNEHICLKK
jgi:HEAT repeat protein